jgi:hypothetical protein
MYYELTCLYDVLRLFVCRVINRAPCHVTTDFNGFRGTRTPDEGAAIVIKLATLDEDGPTGSVFDDNDNFPGRSSAKLPRVSLAEPFFTKFLLHFVGGNDVFIPVAAIFDNALLGFVIDMGNAKALAITQRPLKVIEQCPDMVSA